MVSVATVSDAVRYPDALVTCTKGAGGSYVVPGVIVVFEVLSPTSGRVDQIEKLREYQAVASIRRYVILECASVGLTVLERTDGDTDWTVIMLTTGDTLRMPEVGIEVPVTELYDDVDLPGASNADHPAPAEGRP